MTEEIDLLGSDRHSKDEFATSEDVRHIAEAYVYDIERCLAEDFLTDALEKLIDFVRDFAPQLKPQALSLYARHSRVRRQIKEGGHDVAVLDEIVSSIYELAQNVNSAVLENRSGDTPDARKLAVPPFVNGVITSDGTPVSSLGEAAGFGLDDYRRMYHKKQQAQDTFGGEKVVVSAKSLKKLYIRNKFQLGPVSFELRRGEITGVVGMNASGKTTLINVILGRLQHDEGELSFPTFGERADWKRIKSGLASVDQLPDRWYGRLRYNLNHTAAAYGCFGRENRELVEWYVYRYGLNDYADATWDEISGGFKIRFELVRALLSRPTLLALDEPLAYLDIVTQQLFLSDLRSVASSLENPIAVIVSSQHLFEIESVADRMIILDDGMCLFSDRIDQIPVHREYQCFEVSLRVPKAELLVLLRPIGLADIEVTMTSYLLFFWKQTDRSIIVAKLLELYSDRLLAFRDVSRSTRMLFRNKRDEFESHGSV